MRGLLKLTWVQAKLYLREPVATFFTIFWAPSALVLFGLIYGNAPTPFLGGRGTVDVMVPSYLGLVTVTVALMSVPIQAAMNRETGVLRRYRATPLRPITYLVADVLVYYGMAVLGVFLLILVGKVAFDVRFEGNVFSVLGGFSLGVLSFFSLGYLIAGLAPTARVAQAVGMVLAFPMMFISGATIPLETLPESIRRVANFIPLTHMVVLMRGLWTGQPWGNLWVQVVVLLGVLIVGAAVSALTFRWE